jgi:hypothetical protein
LPGPVAAIENLAMGWQMPTSYCRDHRLMSLARMLPSLRRDSASRLRQDGTAMEMMSVLKLKQVTLAS